MRKHPDILNMVNGLGLSGDTDPGYAESDIDKSRALISISEGLKVYLHYIIVCNG